MREDEQKKERGMGGREPGEMLQKLNYVPETNSCQGEGKRTEPVCQTCGGNDGSCRVQLPLKAV